MTVSRTSSLLAIALSTALTACGSGSSNGIPSSNTQSEPTAPIADANKNTPSQQAIQWASITDNGLSQCIQQTGVRWQAELQLLECPQQHITSLQGLEQFSQLRVLNLSQNQLSHIDELTTLNQLTYLDVSHNKITQLDALAPLQQLRTLKASHNKVMNIDALEPLTHIQRLYINHNHIRDLNGLAKAPALQFLVANNNPATLPSELPQQLQSFVL
ncbi:MAG: leucine-rich repeat protein [Bacterioplanes sp.]|nr:leucine-rich repeat protein [Bacterioplanes sp.]